MSDGLRRVTWAAVATAAMRNEQRLGARASSPPLPVPAHEERIGGDVACPSLPMNRYVARLSKVESAAIARRISTLESRATFMAPMRVQNWRSRLPMHITLTGGQDARAPRSRPPLSNGRVKPMGNACLFSRRPVRDATTIARHLGAGNGDDNAKESRRDE